MTLKVLTLSSVIVATLALSGCATVSEDTCKAGDWEGIGFKDGTRGKSRAQLADITKACGKFQITPDRTAYLRGLEDGLLRYCTPEKGLSAGRDGSGVNNECSVRGFVDYVDAHADGFAEYQIEREHGALISSWKKTQTALLNVEGRLEAADLPEDERVRLTKKARRLTRRARELRIDIRAMERIHGLPRWRPSD